MKIYHYILNVNFVFKPQFYKKLNKILFYFLRNISFIIVSKFLRKLKLFHGIIYRKRTFYR